MAKISVVVPNWNGIGYIGKCLDSLLAQTLEPDIIVVDNNSTDGSAELIQDHYSQVILIKNKSNLGFTGGVNAGIKRSLKLGSRHVALLNNDAVADKKWIEELSDYLNTHPEIGIITGQIINSSKEKLDSTGEFYTSWGLPFARGRGEYTNSGYEEGRVFGASGGASLYRASMFEEIGLFDEDFFAYYEDVDISFRAQLAGWKVAFTPTAKAYHEIGATSGKIKDFTTYQTMKNLPMLFLKNVPLKFMPSMLPRFGLAYSGFLMSAISRGQGRAALKGLAVFLILLPKKLLQRHKIQRKRLASVSYIESIMTYDLPPNAKKLRTLRVKWWRLRGK